MPDGEEKDKEEKKFWWSIETNCFTRVFGDEVQEYLEGMVMDSYPDQVVIKKEESSSSEEEEDELEEEEDEDIDNNDNKNTNSYSSALTTMDWGMRSHPDHQVDYWIGDSGASSHMVGDDKDLFAKTPIKERSMLLMEHQFLWCAKVR